LTGTEDLMRKSLAKRFTNLPVRSVLLLVLAIFATEREARAYADPGSGALIWQLMMAALVGGIFYFHRITAWFKKRKGPRV
jgi:uncharacterized membrane-anchored protein YjiN (DUF445 family)